MKVLVVEDEAQLADAIARGLRREGVAVDTAPDGDLALEKASIIPYDVIVLDRDLPRVHGDDVCATLRAGGTTSRILMLTASGTLEDRVSGLNLGADDYLPKPLAVVEALLVANGAVVSPETLLDQVWDDQVDPFTNVVRVTVMTLRKKL